MERPGKSQTVERGLFLIWTAVHCLSNPWRKPGWVFIIWKSTLATIPLRPRTAARRPKSRRAEVPATSNLASIDISSRCHNSRCSGYSSNAGAKNIAHLQRILQYSICSMSSSNWRMPSVLTLCGMGCLSRWFIKETTAWEARRGTMSKSNGIYKNSKRLERFPENRWQQGRSIQAACTKKVCIDLGCLPALSILIIAIDQQDMFSRIH